MKDEQHDNNVLQASVWASEPRNNEPSKETTYQATHYPTNQQTNQPTQLKNKPKSAALTLGSSRLGSPSMRAQSTRTLVPTYTTLSPPNSGWPFLSMHLIKRPQSRGLLSFLLLLLQHWLFLLLLLDPVGSRTVNHLPNTHLPSSAAHCLPHANGMSLPNKC